MAADLATALDDFLTDTAVVYTPAAVGGEYTVADTTDLRCRVSTVGVSRAPTGPERAELAGLRQVYWGPDYAMPSPAQVELNGSTDRWNISGPVQDYRDEFGQVIYQRADLMRAA